MDSKTKPWRLYVLQLEQGKWYVGITSQSVERRFEQHKQGFAGAAWTRKYKPIKIFYTKDLGECDLNKAQLFESRATRKYMEKYGDNNVRGGDLVSTEEYIRRFGRIWQKNDWLTVTVVVLLLLIIIWLALDRNLPN